MQVRPTGPGPTKTRFGKRDSENGIRKTGLEKRDSKKRDSALSRLGLTKTDSESEIRKNEIRKNEQNGKRDSKNEILNLPGFGKNGIRPSSRLGPAQQKLDHLCLCSAVATPELQAHQQEKVGNSLKEDLAKPGYKSKHESTKCSAWLEWCSHGLPTS